MLVQISESSATPEHRVVPAKVTPSSWPRVRVLVQYCDGIDSEWKTVADENAGVSATFLERLRHNTTVTFGTSPGFRSIPRSPNGPPFPEINLIDLDDGEMPAPLSPQADADPLIADPEFQRIQLEARGIWEMASVEAQAAVGRYFAKRYGFYLSDLPILTGINQMSTWNFPSVQLEDAGGIKNTFWRGAKVLDIKVCENVFFDQKTSGPIVFAHRHEILSVFRAAKALQMTIWPLQDELNLAEKALKRREHQLAVTLVGKSAEYCGRCKRADAQLQRQYSICAELKLRLADPLGLGSVI